MVFSAEVGLDTLTIRGAAAVDVFARFIAANEADGFYSGFVDDEIYGFGRAVDDVDHAVGEAGFLAELGEDHSCAGVAF